MSPWLVEVYRRTAERLVPLVDAPEVPLATKARIVMCLAKVRDPRAAAKVLGFFQDQPDFEEAITALGELGGEDALNALINALPSPYYINRDTMTRMLGQIKGPVAQQHLMKLLADADRHVRFQAVFGLFEIGGRDAALALCKYIGDPDEWISMNILKLLCRMREHESIPYLAERFTHDTDLRRKALMVSFLSRFKSVTLVNIFDEALRFNDARLRANAIEAIGDLQLPQREIQDRIEPFLRDPNNRIRANAILALARSQPELIRQELLDMVQSPDIQLRRSAAFILGQIPSGGNEASAISLIGDAADDVRRRMVLSLKNFPEWVQQQQLERTIVDQNKWIRKHSVDLARALPQFPTDPVLRQLKQESAYPNIVAGIEFFARRPHDEALRYIRARLKDKREQVVVAAIRAIGQLRGPAGMQEIGPLIDSKNPEIFKAFAETHLSLGSLEMYDALLEKAGSGRRTGPSEVILKVLDGLLTMLKLPPAKQPEKLKAELARRAMPESRPVLPEMGATPAAARPRPQPQPVAAPAVLPPVAPVSADATPVPTAVQEGDQPPVLDLDVPLPEVPAVAPAAEEPAEPVRKSPKKKTLPAVFQQALKAYNLGKYKKARELFTQAVQEAPQVTKSHFYLGMMAYEAKDYAAALEAMGNYCANEPDDPKALLILARTHRALKDWAGVEGVLGRLLAMLDGIPDKLRPGVLRDLGMALVALERYEQARDILDQALTLDAESPETAYSLALCSFHLKNHLRAETLLTGLLPRLTPDHKLNRKARDLLEQISGQHPTMAPAVAPVRVAAPAAPRRAVPATPQPPVPPVAQVPAPEEEASPAITADAPLTEEYEPAFGPLPSETEPPVIEVVSTLPPTAVQESVVRRPGAEVATSELWGPMPETPAKPAETEFDPDPLPVGERAAEPPVEEFDPDPLPEGDVPEFEAPAMPSLVMPDAADIGALDAVPAEPEAESTILGVAVPKAITADDLASVSAPEAPEPVLPVPPPARPAPAAVPPGVVMPPDSVPVAGSGPTAPIPPTITGGAPAPRPVPARPRAPGAAAPAASGATPAAPAAMPPMRPAAGARPAAPGVVPPPGAAAAPPGSPVPLPPRRPLGPLPRPKAPAPAAGQPPLPSIPPLRPEAPASAPKPPNARAVSPPPPAAPEGDDPLAGFALPEAPAAPAAAPIAPAPVAPSADDLGLDNLLPDIGDVDLDAPAGPATFAKAAPSPVQPMPSGGGDDPMALPDVSLLDDILDDKKPDA